MKIIIKKLFYPILILIILVIGYKIGTVRSMSPHSMRYYFTLLTNKLAGEDISYDYEDFNILELDIQLSEKQIQKLDDKIKDVVTNHSGWMSSEIDPPMYDKASAIFMNHKFSIKYRLKGNTGNSIGKDYSLRIKTKSKIFLIFNLSTYSLSLSKVMKTNGFFILWRKK